MAVGRNTTVSLTIVGLALGVVAAVIPGYVAARQGDLIRKGLGVSEVRRLSDWFPAIRGASGDTDVYVLDSGTPGAAGLVLGGTHGNEPAGYMTAILIVENAVPASGRILVVRHANPGSAPGRPGHRGSPEGHADARRPGHAHADRGKAGGGSLLRRGRQGGAGRSADQRRATEELEGGAKRLVSLADELNRSVAFVRGEQQH